MPVFGHKALPKNAHGFAKEGFLQYTLKSVVVVVIEKKEGHVQWHDSERDQRIRPGLNGLVVACRQRISAPFFSQVALQLLIVIPDGENHKLLTPVPFFAPFRGHD